MAISIFYKKYLKELHAIVLIFAILAQLIFISPENVYAATYNWTQASWAGGVSGTAATHASNQSGWTNYAAADSGLTIGTNITESQSGISTTSISTFSAASVFDLGSSNLVAVGFAGFIQRSTDNGNTWKILAPVTTNALSDVTCVSSTCYAVGSSGTILKSSDSGATWAAQTSGTTTTMTDISCADANTCWIVNSTNDSLLKTTNGSTWSAQETGYNSSSIVNYDIFFLDANNGWISGTNYPGGHYLKTTNGGSSWSVGSINVPAASMGGSGSMNYSLSMEFADSNTGFASVYYTYDDGYDSTTSHGIAKTTDGGSNWSLVAGNIWSTTLGDIDVVSSTYVVAGAVQSSAPYAYYTTNGSSFSSKSLGGSGSTAPQVSCSSTTNCVAGNGTTADGVFVTSDWWSNVTSHASPISSAQTVRTNLGGFFVSTSTGWYVSTSGLTKKTTNGGKTWSTQTSGVSSTLDSVYCTDSSTCWSVGASGVIRKTTDGGSNWSGQTSGTANALYEVYFVSSSVGWAVGASGTILKTTDGGTNWAAQTSGSASALYGLYCSDSNNCKVVGASGTILSTTDGGTNWAAQTSGTSNQLNDVFCTDSNTCWTAGLSGTILKTTDGGSNWASQGSLSTNLYNISCSDSSTCYAGGAAGVLHKTLNGGTNWSASMTPNQSTTGVTILWSNYISTDNSVVLIYGNGAVLSLSPTYNTSQLTLTSSIYDSGDSGNLVNSLAWTETVPAGTYAKFQIRTSADNNTWTDYVGPDGTTGSYFSNSGTGCSGSGTITCTIDDAISIGNGASDRYMQYKLYVTATETTTPTVDDVVVQYVVNVAPAFDTSYDSNGVSASQNATTTSPVGQVVITYKVKDADTTTGTANAGYVTPTFQYNLNDGNGWQNITSQYLASGDTNNKAVLEASYSTYTATWDVVSQLGTSVSTSTAQIKVTVNDNEGANNTASATESNVSIDTAAPNGSVYFDSRSNEINISYTDTSSQSMRISNNADTSADGTNADSGNWIATTTTKSWTPTGATTETIYFAIRDQYGNTASTTIVSPATLSGMNIQDVSNPASTNPREFISWGVFTNADSLTFSGYKVYRSTTNNSSYSLLATVTDRTQNYYIDSNVASTSRYYYKVAVTDTNGDISNYGEELSDTPDGQGGTDLVAPTITSVTVSNVNSTSATVTWTTDELSSSYVDYSVSPSTAFGSTQSNLSMVTSHSVVLENLTPSTTYLLRARSVDVYDNSGVGNNSGAGYSFTTTGGPDISAVAVSQVTDTTATITWNTDEDSSSLVFYSTSSSLSGSTQAGSASLVGGSGPTYPHSVTLTGLTKATRYYFKVRSVDGTSDIGEDTNSGSYYTFTTTEDLAAPVISSVTTVVNNADTGVVAWLTNERSSTRAWWGTTSGSYTSSTNLDSNYTISHYAVLSGLSAQTAYYYVVVSGDTTGNYATSSESTFTTPATTVITNTYVSRSLANSLAEEIAAESKDTTAPSVTGIVAEPQSLDAQLSFTASEPVATVISYGLQSPNYDFQVASFDFSTKPKFNLSRLQMGSQYHYSIKVLDKAGNFTTIPDATFSTKFLSEASAISQEQKDQAIFQKKIEDIVESALPSLNPPFLSEPRVIEVTHDSAIIEWDSNVNSSSLVAFAPADLYDASSTQPYIAELGNAQERSKTHRVELINLDSATTYHFQARSQGVVGPFGKSADKTFITKPAVPEVSILSVGPNNVAVGWKTNSLTSSYVEYKNLFTGEIRTKGTDDLTREHIVDVDELSPNTRYEMKVFGRDARGNKTESVTRVVSTVRDFTSPRLINVKVSNALVPGRSDRLQTIVSWQTDEPADTQVFYGEGAAVGEELKNKTSLDPVLTTDHTTVISTLKPGTVYRFRVVSVDQVGNRSESPIQIILTPQQAESVIDVISNNLEQTFGWIKILQR